MPKPTKWTDELVISGILEFAKTGAMINQHQIIIYNACLLRAAQRRFGSMRAACAAAGVKYESRPAWTHERVIRELHAAADSGVVMQSVHLYKQRAPLADASRRFFGSVKKAIQAAGLQYVERQPRIGPRQKPGPKRIERIVVEPVKPFAIQYPAIDREFDYRPKGEGRVLNRIISPLGMSESQRTGMQG